MRSKKLSIGLGTIPTIFTVTLFATSTWAATEKKLHNFGLFPNDGNTPEGALVMDAAGNLYGTTSAGGGSMYGGGIVFELTPNDSGGWTETVIHDFGIGSDNASDSFSALIFDSAGNLYGTSREGGASDSGTVFEVSPDGFGGWTEKKLHNFGLDQGDGNEPNGALVIDSAGNLYGTTVYGGANNGGTVFELSPNFLGGWTETILHNFGNSDDGLYPYAGLVLDSDGNLYGTTYSGGHGGGGTVFELTPGSDGTWTEKKLHNFGLDQTDGIAPWASLIFDVSGSLYGTTTRGGSHGGGTAFELSPNADGSWTESKLHNFASYDWDGNFPYGGLTFDSAGYLFGTTTGGGDYASGTVFELYRDGNGNWLETKLHNFDGLGEDGIGPEAGVTLDLSGNIYGTTYAGGDFTCDGESCGTIFEVTP